MGRLILLGLLVVLVVWLLRRALAAPRKPPAQAGEQKGEPQSELVSCAHCLVNLPKAEAYAARGVPPGADGRHYCSEEHWRAGPRDG